MIRPAIIAALLTFGPAASAQTGEAWTSARVRATNPDQLVGQLFGDLSPFLVPDTEINEIFTRFGRLGRLSFYSIPRAGFRSGLCETDWVQLSFAPVHRVDQSSQADVPVRPRRIEAGRVHFIRDLERALRGGIRAPGEQDAFDDACAALDPRRQTRIIAHDTDDIIIALRLLRELTDAARAGRALAPIDCSGLARRGQAPPKDADCLAELAAIRLDQIVHAALPEVEPAGVIRRIDTDSRRLELTFRPGETVESWNFAMRAGVVVPVSIVIRRFPDPAPTP